MNLLYAFIFACVCVFVLYLIFHYVILKYLQEEFTVNENNSYHFLSSPKDKKTNETINWINVLISQIITHLKGENNTDFVEKINQLISKKLPPGYFFELDSLGEDFIIETPLIHQEEGKINNFSLFIPFDFNDLAFTILSQVDGNNKDEIVKIPLLEFNLIRFKSALRIEFDSSNKIYLSLTTPIKLDFDSTLIINQRRITFTRLHAIGLVIVKFLTYKILKKKLEYSLPDFDSIINAIKSQDFIPVDIQIV